MIEIANKQRHTFRSPPQNRVATATLRGSERRPDSESVELSQVLKRHMLAPSLSKAAYRPSENSLQRTGSMRFSPASTCSRYRVRRITLVAGALAAVSQSSIATKKPRRTFVRRGETDSRFLRTSEGPTCAFNPTVASPSRPASQRLSVRPLDWKLTRCRCTFGAS